MLERAKVRVELGRYAQVRLVEGDAANLSFPEGSFDRVICTHALSIIPRSREALRRAVLALKPGGKLAVADLKRLEAPSEVLEPWYEFVVNPVFESIAYGLGCSRPGREMVQEMRLLLEDVTVSEYLGGAVYVAVGQKAQAATHSAAS
jgi:demethylmenaquinone methyltransferase/2-methoxy-6-polyprenyl-1,4-benzoquinol methylase